MALWAELIPGLLRLDLSFEAMGTRGLTMKPTLDPIRVLEPKSHGGKNGLTPAGYETRGFWVQTCPTAEQPKLANP